MHNDDVRVHAINDVHVHSTDVGVHGTDVGVHLLMWAGTY